mmetsp:Transcript_117941/g.366685  ORF Transcript_117941/g.366685 Transcript_117941/m.366685 type:complete len:572 (+) Transcript_117941:50-1765(+)
MGAEASAPRFNAAEFVGTFQGPLSSKYEILKQLGSGAQGAAYLVRMRNGDVEYVAKETLDMTEEGKDDFKQEFEKMRLMRHPNCVKVIELVEGKELIDGEWKEQLFVISELARGSDLYKYMRKAVNGNVTLTEEWVAGVYRQAMQGVAYIHSKGIVHNDLKPDNILMLDAFDPSDPNRVPTVAINDFGCATLSSDQGFKCGDLRYQSAESWRAIKLVMQGESLDGVQKLDAKADVWSMGATLFELLSGGLIPFLYRPCTLDDITGNEEVMEELGNAILQTPVLVRPSCASVSPEGEDLLQRVFRKEPAERPSAEEVLKHSWFGIKGKPMAEDIQWKLEFMATKGLAHRILLNALSTKLQRDHYQQSWRIFQEVDDNQSGTIGPDEFKTALERMGRADEDPELLFRQTDVDNDGAVDFNEFMALTFDWKSLDPKSLEQEVRKVIADLDTDGTGDVDQQELGKVFQGMLEPGELQDVFERMDGDGDSRVSVQEMQQFLFEPTDVSALAKYSVRRRTLAKAEEAGEAQPAAAEEAAAPPAPRPSGAPDAQFLCGTVLPAAVGAFLCFHGVFKLF